MAHATTHDHDLTFDEALQEINSDRSRRSRIALLLFVLSGAAISAAFYYSYRDVPAPANPANASPVLAPPYR